MPRNLRRRAAPDARAELEAGRSCGRGRLTRACALAALLAAATTAQEVRLPLERFHELERRARETAPLQRPAAPFVLERAALDVVFSAERARIEERLELVVSDEGWQRLALPSPGRWVSVELGALEGRLDEEGDDLVFRGPGRHTLTLTAVAAIERRTRFGRTEWSVAFATPAAGVVVGSARTEATGTGQRDAALEIAGGGVALGAPGADGTVRFAALPAATLTLALRAEEATPTRAEEAVVDLDAVTLARVRPTRLAFVDQLLLHTRGELSEVVLELPAGSTVNAVRGSAIDGWRVEDDGTLRVSLDLRVSGQSGPLLLEIARDLPLAPPGAPPSAAVFSGEREAARTVIVTAATPRLQIERSRRAVFGITAEADGIITLLEPGASRGLSVAVAGDLRDRLPVDAQRTARLLADGGAAPRWEVAWPDDTQVLAATIDTLHVDWLWGASGRAGLRIGARVRSTGLEVLELELPESFELTGAAIDGAPIEPGRRAGLWAIPLRVDSAAQLVTLEGLATVARPADGVVLELAVPAASAPISRVEVRGVLDGRYQYRLVDAERLETGRRVRGSPGDGSAWPVPPGHVTVDAGWGALSTRPGPLRVEVRDEPEEATWY